MTELEKPMGKAAKMLDSLDRQALALPVPITR